MENKHIQNQYDNDMGTAVLLVNFGGPKDLNEVKPFLYNLFSDPAIINLPFAFLYRKPLAWLISSLREKASKEMYKKVSTENSQIPITHEQKDKLQEMFIINKLKVNVFVGLRYSHPCIEDVLNEIKLKGYERVIVLPLFPQFSFTTVGSVNKVVNNWHKKNKDFKIFFISNWYEDEDYIESFVSLIRNELKDMDLRSTEIIFSAHSIPISNVKNGDPYEYQIKKTAEAIIQKLDWKKKWHIAYQSKLGPVKWLEPSTDKVIEEIAKRNKNANVLVIPISFVSENVETIYEIGMLYKEIADKAGIKRFVRVPALNEDKYLIQALYNQVVSCLDKHNMQIKELMHMS